MKSDVNEGTSTSFSMGNDAAIRREMLACRNILRQIFAIVLSASVFNRRDNRLTCGT